MRKSCLLVSVMAALSLVVMGCGQCAIGHDITQVWTIGGDITCLIMLVVFVAGIIFLVMLPGIFGGFGGGREG